MHHNLSYLKSPSIYENKVTFVSDNNLWLWDLENSQLAQQLTNLSSTCARRPLYSPDGSWIAFTQQGLSSMDAYLIGSQGGLIHRLSFFSDAELANWYDEEHILIQSARDNFHPGQKELFKINIFTKEFEKITLGPANAYFQSTAGTQILARHLNNPARWKRYRGGSTGTLWADKKGDGQFRQILKNLSGNLASPVLFEERIYFLSDHEGVANIYSCNDQGRALKRHTHHKDYYVRSLDIHNGHLVYECNAEIYMHDLAAKESERVNINLFSNFNQAISRFVDSEDNLQDFDVSEEGSEICVLSRGKLFVMPPWSGAPLQLGDDHARYKKPLYIERKDREMLIAVKIDESAIEKIVLFDLDELSEEVLCQEDIGKIWNLTHRAQTDEVYFSNSRNQLFQLNIKTKKLTLIDTNKNDYFRWLNFSPNARYLATIANYDEVRKGIKIYDLQKKDSQFLFEPVYVDEAPVFSPCGRYLAFIGIREFNPTYNEARHDYSFGQATRAYLVNLKEQDNHPLERHLDFEKDDKDEEDDSKDEDIVCLIDFDNIQQRIVALPIELGGHSQLYFCEDRLFFSKSTNKAQNPHNGNGDDEKCDLMFYDFKSKKQKTFASDFHMAKKSYNNKYLLMDTEDQLRLSAVDQKLTDGENHNRKDGWIDLERIKYKHSPRQEWRQMYDEAWLLQKENFWKEDMAGVDWEDVYFKYLPTLDKVNTREELSDLIAEMQGELATSHCYEFGGDYHLRSNEFATATLAAQFHFDSKNNSYIITEVAPGYNWIKNERSPLTDAGVELNVGDRLFAFNGKPFQEATDLYSLLEDWQGQKINLLVKRKGSKEKELLSVQTNNSDRFCRYRQWSEHNREYVHQQSQGKLGYVHLPNMHVWGFSEFYRNFLSEYQYQGLIVDARYNGGGNLSEKIIRELIVKTFGKDHSRWFGTFRYPQHSVPGPIIALANEFSGSDGDIFSHAFKYLKLGKLVGKRTWGGVIGIWPRFGLNDSTFTTQPEFSFWFKDVGFGIENHGVDPDIEVDITPQDWREQKDPQLDKAIEVALKDLKKNPHPEFY